MNELDLDEGGAVKAEREQIEKALAVLTLDTRTRRWLAANDPKALAQADAAIEKVMPIGLKNARAAVADLPPAVAEEFATVLRDKLGAERAAHEIEHAKLQGNLDRLKERQVARAKYIRALGALRLAAANLRRVFDEIPAGVLGSLGGHPEYIDTYEGFAHEMAEWEREQALAWIDPEEED